MLSWHHLQLKKVKRRVSQVVFFSSLPCIFSDPLCTIMLLLSFLVHEPHYLYVRVVIDSPAVNSPVRGTVRQNFMMRFFLLWKEDLIFSPTPPPFVSTMFVVVFKTLLSHKQRGWGQGHHANWIYVDDFGPLNNWRSCCPLQLWRAVGVWVHVGAPVCISVDACGCARVHKCGCARVHKCGCMLMCVCVRER